MDRLSSCYFCGDALDAALDEYPVVPPMLDPDDGSQQTIVLCSDCRRKLEAVLESVVDAVDEPAEPDGAAEPGSSPEPGSSAGATDSDSSDDPADDAEIESALEGGEDVLRSVGGEPGDGTASTEPEANGSDALAGSNGRAGADGASDAATNGATEESASPRDERETGAAPDRDRSPTGTDASGGAGKSAGSFDDGAGGTGGPDDGANGAGGPDDGASLTRLEYNKVMRLLQNREFPVDREGFVNVAANAYELSHHEVEQVLDVAIEKGLIAQDGDQLVDADG